MDKHHKVLGILYTYLGVFYLLGLLLSTVLDNALGGPTGSTELTVIRNILAPVYGAAALLSLVGGVALLKRQKWAEGLLKVLGFVLLIVIPYGAMLGIYSIWVFSVRGKNASRRSTVEEKIDHEVKEPADEGVNSGQSTRLAVNRSRSVLRVRAKAEVAIIWNFFKVCIRNLRRQKVFSIINILGLTVGLTAVLLIALNIEFEHSFNSFNKNADRIYRIGVVAYRQGKQILNSPQFVAALGPAMANELPEVESSVRIRWPRNMYLKYDNKPFHVDNVIYADSNMFSMFSFRLLEGNKNEVLNNPRSIVLTRTTASLIFGDSSAVGRVVTIENTPYLVSGVSEDPPANSDIQFGAVISFSSMYGVPMYGVPSDLFLSWNGGMQFATYVELKKNVSADELDRRLSALVSSHETRLEQMGIKINAHLEPLLDLHLYYNDDSTALRQNLNIFSAIALFILLIACANFVNLSTARATGRAKEVGMRKVLGAERKSLISQFLAESILFVFVAVLLALVLVELLLPWYSDLIGKDLILSPLLNGNFILILLAVLFITSIGAGLYPASVLSSFSPMNTLKSSIVKGSGKPALRKSLVILQFSISLVLMISTLIINKQLGFMRSMNLGYHRNNMLVVCLDNESLQTKCQAFKNELRTIPGVVDAAASTEVPGNDFTSNGYFPEGYKQPLMIHVVDGDEDFLSAYGLKLIKGRNFNPQIGSDKQSYIINESLAKLLDWSNPLDKKITRNGIHPVIGEVRDFNYAPLYDPIKPLIITDQPEGGEPFNYVSVRLGHGNLRQIMSSVEKVWKEFAPSLPFDYFFLDQQFNDVYKTEIRFREVFLIFSGLAIFVALLGLLGLVSYTVELRRREIGVRKVLGSSVPGIISLLSNQYVKWILAANIIAWPIAYYAMQKWLQNFAYKTTITPWVFVGAAAIELLVAVIAMSIQALRAATANPVDSLRYE